VYRNSEHLGQVSHRHESLADVEVMIISVKSVSRMDIGLGSLAATCMSTDRIVVR
jgi:hypothetical protein